MRDWARDVRETFSRWVRRVTQESEGQYLAPEVREVQIRNKEFLELDYLIEAARRGQDQLEKAFANLDEKANKMIRVNLVLLGALVTLFVGLPSLAPLFGISPSEIDVLFRFLREVAVWLLVGIMFLMLSLAFAIISYFPRTTFMDLGPRGLMQIVKEQSKPVYGKYNLLLSTVDSSFRNLSNARLKALELKVSMWLLLYGVLVLVMLAGWVLVTPLGSR